jgi:hypothetical protein
VSLSILWPSFEPNGTVTEYYIIAGISAAIAGAIYIYHKQIVDWLHPYTDKLYQSVLSYTFGKIIPDVPRTA